MTLNDCILLKVDQGLLSDILDFSCKKAPEIEKFFKEDAEKYENHLLGKSYCFIRLGDDKKGKAVAAFTLSNTSLNVKDLPSSIRNKINRTIPNSKRKGQYPAVLLGQLAITDEFEGQHIGDSLLNYIETLVTDDNYKTGCRYLIVDALNKEKVLQFYLNNGFKFLYPTSEEEASMTDVSLTETKRTRLMYFDLMQIK